MRLMGKRQLGELQPSELVSTILISNLASIPIESVDIPLLTGIVPVLLLVSIEVLLSAISTHSRRFETFLSGSPQILIQDGTIDQQVLKELRFSPDDLICALRQKDVFDLREVELCLVETNGSISVCTVSEENAAKPATFLPVLINGQLDQTALRCCGVDETWVKNLLKKRHVNPNQVMLLLCSKDQQYQIIKKLRDTP